MADFPRTDEERVREDDHGFEEREGRSEQEKDQAHPRGNPPLDRDAHNKGVETLERVKPY